MCPIQSRVFFIHSANLSPRWLMFRTMAASENIIRIALSLSLVLRFYMYAERRALFKMDGIITE
jgi:hypothetical protein